MEKFYELSSSIIGKNCTTQLFVKGNFYNLPCLKLIVSKLLSYGIILGAVVVKVPQVIKIVDSRSAEGLSYPAYLLETIASSITFAYNIRANNAFSTYGETLFMTVQNVVITLLILLLNRKIIGFFLTMIAYSFFSFGLYTPALVDVKMMAILQASTIPIFVASRIPQILQTYSNGHTGQLSALTVLLVWLGSVARVFTTMQEVKDSLLLVGFCSAAFLNTIIAGQMVYYWRSKPAKKAKSD